jgi:LysM repeat protein
LQPLLNLLEVDIMVNAIDCATKLTDATATALANEGIKYAGRYLGHSWKGLEAPEVAAIKNAGMQIFSIFEQAATKVSYFTAAQGQKDAAAAAALAKELGQPEGSAIYFAVDYDAQAADLAAIAAYFKAVKDNLPGYIVGAYGSFRVIEYLKGSGLVTYYFQTYAWSKGQKSAAAHIYQYKNDVRLAGVGVDYNEICQANVGTWGGSATAAPATATTTQPAATGGSYIVKSGDTLSEIAARNNTTVAKLQELNNIVDPNKIFAGQAIKLPGSAAAPTAQAAPASGGTYTVKPGDTLSGIAAANHTTAQALAAINNISNPNLIYAGQVIKLSGSAAAAAAPQPQPPAPEYYVIKPGDALSKIAAKFGTSQAQLQAWNNIKNANVIYAGQKIRVK